VTEPGAQEPSFYRRILDDVQSSAFKKTVRGDLRDLYAFYLDEEARERLATTSRIKRWFLIGFWLIKGLILNLSPARRVLLLVSVWFFLQSHIGFTVGETNVRLDLSIFGFLLLLLVLMLELKDKLLARNELEVGRTVQLALLPRDPPRLPGWDICLYTRPANDAMTGWISRWGTSLERVWGRLCSWPSSRPRFERWPPRRAPFRIWGPGSTRSFVGTRSPAGSPHWYTS
jgi:hypothetical protein